MSHVANRFVVIFDANVLYPFRMRDILLTFCEAGLLRGRWTDQITDEWVRNLLAQKPAFEASIKSQVAAMQRAFPEAWVEEYEHLVPVIELPDPDDRHVVAAAIKCGAQVIVTANLKHFPSEPLAQFDIEAVQPDDFLLGIFELYPTESIRALRRLRRSYDRPPLAPSEFIFDLIAKGMPKLAGALKSHRDLL